MLTKVASLGELDRLMVEASAAGSEADRVARLTSIYIDDPRLHPSAVDPMSPEYVADVLRIYELASGRSGYNPARDELTDLDPREWGRRPNIYRGDSVHLGTFLEAIGQILKIVPIQAGGRVLEFGPGEGQICLPLARIGCDVTVIDIEPRNFETIRFQASALDLDITYVLAEFNDPLPPGPFDLVVFFEAFHHAIYHRKLLASIRKVITPGGRLVLAGEPIIEEGSYWSTVVPFPWGLRLDGLSLSAVRHYGWMELGFQEGYLIEAAMRAGFLVEKMSSPTNGRATSFVLRAWKASTSFAEAMTFPSTRGLWHSPEEGGRWSSPRVTLPLPDEAVGGRVLIELSHRATARRTVSLRAGPEKVTVSLKPNTDASIEIEVTAPYLDIDVSVHGSEHRRERIDPRKLGIFVKRLVFSYSAD